MQKPEDPVRAAALRVVEAMNAEANLYKMPLRLALTLVDLERAVRNASYTELKQALKDVERHPSPDSRRTYALVRRVDRKGGLCPTGDWEDVPPEEERAAFTAALAEAGFADTLAKKCDELQAEIERGKLEVCKVCRRPSSAGPGVNFHCPCGVDNLIEELKLRKLLEDAQAELVTVKRERNFVAASDDAFWIWSDTDPNSLDSLCEGSLVKMTAGQLRKLLSQEHVP
jgi:hypothetical protein